MSRKETIEDIASSINAMKHKMQSAMTKQGKLRVPLSQCLVLFIIQANPRAGIKDIAAALSITSSAATQLVDALVASGYVVRKSDSLDRRSLNISLSKKGHKSIATMRQRHLQAMEKIFSPLSDAELKTYLSLHKKIVQVN